MAAKINQKEYLKKYLSSGKDDSHKKKKKKKSATKSGQNVRIIDDDVDISKLQNINDDDLDLLVTGEDAPQIVGVIDDRPPDLIAKDYRNNTKWKVVSNDNGFESSLSVREIGENGRERDVVPKHTNQDHESPRRKSKKKKNKRDRSAEDTVSPKRKGRQMSDDISPPRRTHLEADSSSLRKKRSPDASPPRRRKERSPDMSPKRKSNKSPDASPPRKRNRSRDASPPRRRNRSQDASPRRKNRSPDASPRRRNRSPDASPSRRRNRSSDASPRRRNRSPDASPPRRRNRSSDASPPRRKNQSPDRRNRTPESSNYRQRNRSPDDNTKQLDSASIKIKKEKSPLPSPERATISRRKKPSRFGSPTRIKQEPFSPSRIKEEKITPPSSPVPSTASRHHSKPSTSRQQRPGNNDRSPSRRRNSRSPSSRQRYSRSPTRSRRICTPELSRASRSSSPSPSTSSTAQKMTKTLDGKAAGLQNAADLRVENKKFRERESHFFENLTEESSGRHAEAVRRDRNTGSRRDLEAEAEVERKRDKKKQEKKAIYDRWGAGVKQVEDHRQKLEEQAHEMSKPLARYANDNDLDDYLKNQERIGDPMLDYMRQKNKDKAKESGIPMKPTYEGTYPDNRFNIRPGHKWDGVDRSNGFEKKWFEVISKKKAGEEEAYRYSTEDM